VKLHELFSDDRAWLFTMHLVDDGPRACFAYTPVLARLQRNDRRSARDSRSCFATALDRRSLTSVCG
jgi:hypothetical protein